MLPRERGCRGGTSETHVVVQPERLVRPHVAADGKVQPERSRTARTQSARMPVGAVTKPVHDLGDQRPRLRVDPAFAVQGMRHRRYGDASSLRDVVNGWP